jgi:S-(hydroxymethyl)glutathione dehydrogenase/alcohol dehydrogenase
MMKTRAAVLYELNKPLRIEELTVPDLQPGQVLVEVAFSGVCHSQLMEARGKRGEDRFLPHLLGHEGSGVVVEVGSQVSKVEKGDKVVLTWIKGQGADCAGARYHKGDLPINSGAVTTFSDYAVISENRCVKLPGGIPMDVASLFGCAVLTGAGIVLNTMRPAREHSIVIWGVGGIGLSALMAAKLCECSTITAVDTQDSKLALAQEFGATHLINARVEDALERIRQIVGEPGVDFAVEAAGRAGTIEQAFQSVRKGGGLCVFASHPPAGEKICLDPHDLISGKQIRGSWGGESQPDEDIPRFAELYRQGKLPLEKLITQRYPLEQINRALDDLEQGRVGRALIVIGECGPGQS